MPPYRYRQKARNRNASEHITITARAVIHTTICSGDSDQWSPPCRRSARNPVLVLRIWVQRTTFGVHWLWRIIDTCARRWVFGTHSVSSIRCPVSGASILGGRKTRRFNHSLCGWLLLIVIWTALCTGNHSPLRHTLQTIAARVCIVLKYDSTRIRTYRLYL